MSIQHVYSSELISNLAYGTTEMALETLEASSKNFSAEENTVQKGSFIDRVGSSYREARGSYETFVQKRTALKEFKAALQEIKTACSENVAAYVETLGKYLISLKNDIDNLKRNPSDMSQMQLSIKTNLKEEVLKEIKGAFVKS